MKSRFENCYFRSPLQLMHYKPNSDAFSQITLYTQYSGKNFEVGGSQDLVFCTILNASWYRLVFFSLSLFCLFWFGFQFCFWNTKQLVCSKVVALLIYRSGLPPCRQLKKGNNATLCPDLSLLSLLSGLSQMLHEQRVLWTEFPLLSGVISTWSERI